MTNLNHCTSDKTVRATTDKGASSRVRLLLSAIPFTLIAAFTAEAQAIPGCGSCVEPVPRGHPTVSSGMACTACHAPPVVRPPVVTPPVVTPPVVTPPVVTPPVVTPPVVTPPVVTPPVVTPPVVTPPVVTPPVVTRPDRPTRPPVSTQPRGRNSWDNDDDDDDDDDDRRSRRRSGSRDRDSD